MSATPSLTPVAQALSAGPPVALTAVRAVSRSGLKGRRLTVAAALVAGDLAALILAAAAHGETRALLAPSPLLPVPAVLLIGLNAVADLYSGYGPAPAERLRSRVLAALTAAAASAVLLLRDGEGTLAIARALGFCGLFALVGFYAEAIVRHALVRARRWGAATVVVGTGADSRQLAATLLAQPELALRPVALVAEPGGQDAGSQIAVGPDLLPVVRDIATAKEVRPDLEVAIVPESAQDTLSTPGRLPVRRVVVARRGGPQCLWLRTRALGDSVGVELRRQIYSPQILWLKRMTDGLLAVPAAVLATPLVLLLAVLVRIADPGPAFFVQERVGRNGRTIRILKLRTMYVDATRRLAEHLAADPAAAAEWRAYYKLSRDPRILPGIGAFLRKSSLDELPQLFNVVRGDISLVGPRPFPAYHLDGFDAGFRDLRCSVPPGLTGLWQVSARSDGNLEVQKAQDTFYIQNWSIWLDIYVLLQTPAAVLLGSGAR